MNVTWTLQRPLLELSVLVQQQSVINNRLFKPSVLMKDVLDPSPVRGGDGRVIILQTDSPVEAPGHHPGKVV